MRVVADGVDVEFDGRVCTLRAHARFSAWIIGGRERRIDVDEIGSVSAKRRTDGSIRLISLALTTGRLDLTWGTAPRAGAVQFLDALRAAGLKQVRRISLFTASVPASQGPFEAGQPRAEGDADSRIELHQRLAADMRSLVRRRSMPTSPRPRIRLTLRR